MARIPFNLSLGLIVLPLKVEGIIPDNFRDLLVALDTGASTTSIPTKIASDLGYNLSNPKAEEEIITDSGIERMKRITVRKLTAIGETVENIDVLCHELPEDSIIDGVLGLNFLAHFDVNILFSTGTIELHLHQHSSVITP